MTYSEQADHISNLIKQRLGARGPDLNARFRRAGRMLPRHVQQDVQVLINAVDMQNNPKLARMVDDGAVQRSVRAVETHLQSIDVKKRRSDRIMGILANVGVQIIVIFAALLAVIYWRDLI